MGIDTVPRQGSCRRNGGALMVATLYQDTGYVLSHLVEEIKHGKVALPEIQRPFVWSTAKVRDLFDSMYRGYPVGTLMFWETGADVGARQIGGQEEEQVASLLVVDGQQRLTSLYAVLTGKKVFTKTYRSQHLRVAFRPGDETFEVTDAAIEKAPEFIADITRLWDGGYGQVRREFLARLADSRPDGLDDGERDRLEERIDRVRDLKDFRFQVVVLGAKADEEQVAEIFVRTNSKGVKLSQSDFILTLMSVHWEKGRRELEAFCRAATDVALEGPSPKNDFLEPGPDQLLRVGVGLAFNRGRLQHVYSLLRGKDLETGEVSAERRAAQFEALRKAQEQVVNLTNWHEFLKCLKAAGFRSSRMVTSENAVLFTYVLWLIGRNRFGMEYAPLRVVISRWFFMAHTTGRYTSSVESTVEADLGRIAAIPSDDPEAFRAELDRIVYSNFTGDYWKISLPNWLETSASRSPALYAYYAALNLLDAELLFSKLKIRDLMDPRGSAPRAVERHHLFPKSVLAERGITANKQVNAIANRAFVDWPDNVQAHSADPAEYWSDMTHNLGPDRLQQQAHWHALPAGWQSMEYATFLERRRKAMAQVIRDGFATLSDSSGPAPAATVRDLIRAGESQTIEFKSTARWSVRGEQLDRRLEHVIVKTVGALLNADGGFLLIGVDDHGEVLGLDADWSTLGRNGHRDGYELWLRQLLDSNLSQKTAGLVRIRFETLNGKDVCLVSVMASAKAVFTKPHGGKTPTEFWVRTGNATKQLHGDDMAEYQRQHWG